MNETAISWTGFTWNYPIGGCKKISEECKHCYAFSLAEGRRGTTAFPHGFDMTPRVHKRVEPAKLLRSKGPSLVFVNSMTDIGLADSELPTEERDRLGAAGIRSMDQARDMLLDAIEETPEHRYQLLTKRPEIVLGYLQRRGRRVPSSVWMGVTIGHPKRFARLEVLRRFRDLGARVLFSSGEPLLGELPLDLSGIDWIITGGESGLHASNPKILAERFLVRRGDRQAGEPPWVPREDRADWVRRIRDEADRRGCAHWFKQWGGPRPESGGRILDGRTHDGMPVHVPGAMPAGYVHQAPSPKGSDKVQLRML